ncbi:hypothetical protein CHLRE_11g467596v5 [Chlamydomonas reinhardtii]|uniref:Uncharacterized protein n=1 Tax=Chlamydomonas reinhardtii TaxID=3055 RepID=A0A2K3D7E4_CHLRE|nr:uncharacterized protein CHLRE_11g467596v5 [Chlamydomonas reinhardtii]PNW76449.1 hypothetical protein CHLRE_11g467596v5 [Chlamydomonas reinhardtii]
MAPMTISASGAQPASRPTTPAPWRTQLGKESRLPNLYYGAISPDSLRRLSTFTALPPPEQLSMGPWEGCYRYVRQDSSLWSALHAGRLTTSRLKDALGLRDRTAARIVGGPQAAEEGVSKAYQHLTSNQLYTPAVAGPGTAAVAGAGGEGPPPPPPRDEVEALARNEAARLGYNAQLAVAAAAAAAEGRPMPPEPGWDEADRRRISELAALAVGASGGRRMRLLWGTLQESSAVATVGLLFPDSQLEEVGLLCLTSTARWGVDAAELPPLGASPDALITHHVPITLGDLEAARTALVASGALASGEVAATAAARAAAAGVLRAALERHTAAAVAAWASGESPLPGAAAQQAAAAGADGGSSRGSGGGSGGGGGSSSGSARPPPPLHCDTTEEAEAWVAQQLLLRPASVAATAGQAGSSSSGSGSSSGGTEDVAAVVRIREVVEVKNHCPFVYKDQRKARKRGVVINYAASDRGPVSGLWPLWVPQLQAHMAAAGTASGLLLSRSPSRGVKLFRVYRDDGFLASAWELVRELQASHVLRRVPPGPDPWSGRPGYGGLIERVVGLAGGAQVLVETRGTPLLPGADPDAFWNLR